jgi:uncharacterized membrane protein YkvI
VKIIDISLLIVGAVIGAGFATGAEIAAFFGNIPLPAPLLALFIFITHSSLISAIIFLRQKGTGGDDKYSKNERDRTGVGIKIFTLCLYFVLFTAMTAGIREIANYFICIISLAVSVIVVQCGFDKMAKFNTAIVVAIVVLLPTICLPYLGLNTHPKTTIDTPINIIRAIIAALLYGALNCCMLDKIIDGCKNKTPAKKLYLSAVLSAVIISAFAYLILTAIRTNNAENFAVPLLSVSNNAVTFIVILLAILTSQYSALYAILSIFAELKPKTKNKNTPVIIVILLAFGCSFLGFSKLVGIFYPIIGLIIFLFLIFSLLFSFRPLHGRSLPPTPNHSVSQHTLPHRTPPH